MTFFRVVDFETSGEAPEGEVIEVGWADLFGNSEVFPPVSLVIRPTRPVSIETRAVHHLTPVELDAGSSRSAAFAVLEELPHRWCDVPGDLDAVYVAHSAKFEQAWFPEAKLPWICTYKCALRLWPESPRHSNQVLRYFLGLELPASLAMPPHRAGPDAYVTAHILAKMLDRATPAELIEWSGQPALLPRVTFGKQRGMAWTEVDDGFLDWVVRRDFDEDVLHTVRTEIARREAAWRAEEDNDPERMCNEVE